MNPRLFNKVLKSVRERSDYLVGEIMVFLNKVGVLSFPEKIIKSYKMVKIKVSKSSFTNMVYTGGAHGPS